MNLRFGYTDSTCWKRKQFSALLVVDYAHYSWFIVSCRLQDNPNRSTKFRYMLILR